MALATDGQPRDGLLGVRSVAPVRGLGPAKPGSVGTFSDAQNRAVLIVAVTAASISLVVAVVSLRWFLSMKRSFRHHLILMLICSDTFKALWYFLSPVVIFTHGKFGSSSAFVQASGFLLALGVEAADLSILFIALHSTLYILRPPQRLGHGGLYKYRHWVYALWLLLPLLAASLAFTNRTGPAYVTLGTVAYLPKRPFWYRLALAWIPRYIIFISIIAMYTAIYIYVKVKFQGFNNFGSDDLSYQTSSMAASTIGLTSHFESSASHQITSLDNYGREAPAFSTYDSPNDVANGQKHLQATDNGPEWDKIDFITRSPLVNPKRISQLSVGKESADFAHGSTAKPNDSGGRLSPYRFDTRNDSAAPTVKTDFTGRTTLTAGNVDSSHVATRSSPALERTGATDGLAVTRIAIRRQLRFLFIYPIIYLLLWILPFVHHCMAYTNYYTAHPPFWLNVCITCILALQAGIDCAIFSWRERPWKRMSGSPFITVWAFRKLRARFLTKDWQRSQRHGNNNNNNNNNMDPADPEAVKPNKPKRDSNWWEEEGKKRKDSVWLGTDTVNDIVRTQTMESRKASCPVE